MKLKLRSTTGAGSVTIEKEAAIKEVMINEDFLHPNHESIAIGFRNKDASGIIEISTEEFDKLVVSVQRKLHLIKGVKALGREGAIRFGK